MTYSMPSWAFLAATPNKRQTSDDQGAVGFFCGCLIHRVGCRHARTVRRRSKRIVPATSPIKLKTSRPHSETVGTGGGGPQVQSTWQSPGQAASSAPSHCSVTSRTLLLHPSMGVPETMQGSSFHLFVDRFTPHIGGNALPQLGEDGGSDIVERGSIHPAPGGQ